MRRGVLLAAVCAALAAGLASPAAVWSASPQASHAARSLFDLSQAPDAQHFVANWRDERGQTHRVELWRQGVALRRDSDARLSIYATRLPGPAGEPAEARYEVVDRARKVYYEVDRANLNRLGLFQDWDALAHAIVTPRGAFTLSKQARADGRYAGQRCVWYLLDQAGGSTDICWSAPLALPLAERSRAADGTWRDVWTVQSVENRVDARRLRFDAGDFVRFDANDDLSPGSD